jgi:regulator of sigma E protease
MSPSEIKELVGTPWAILLAVFFLCASIIIHELGHFLAAKWRGLVVERFSIGFGPRLFGWTRNGVDYRVSAIPLGGYVALPQLAGVRGVEGESEYKDGDLPPLSVKDKIIVSLAGPFFNVLFAVMLGIVIWITGRPVDASLTTTTVGYVAKELVQNGNQKVPGPAWEAGLRPGDRLLAIDGVAVGEWSEVAQAVATSSGLDDKGVRVTSLRIVREGREMILSAKPILAPDNGMREIGILPAMPAVVGDVFPNSPAMRAGLKKGDRVVAIDGEPVGHILAAGRIIAKTPPAPHKLTLLRGGETLDVTLTPEMADMGGAGQRPMIGIRWAAEDKVLVHENPFVQVGNVIYMTFDVLHALVNPRSDISMKDMSGPVGIAHALFLSAKEGIALLLFLVVFININLAIVNLLPIPVLDGGHIAFAILEEIRGKPLPPKFMATSQLFFMVLLFGLMIYITLQDISREVDMAKVQREVKAAEKAPDPVFKSGDAKPAATPESAPAPKAVPAK